MQKLIWRLICAIVCIFLLLLFGDYLAERAASREFGEIKHAIVRDGEEICSGGFRRGRFTPGFVKCFINPKTKSLLVYFYDKDGPDLNPWFWAFEDRNGETAHGHY